MLLIPVAKTVLFFFFFKKRQFFHWKNWENSLISPLNLAQNSLFSIFALLFFRLFRTALSQTVSHGTLDCKKQVFHENGFMLSKFGEGVIKRGKVHVPQSTHSF